MRDICTVHGSQPVLGFQLLQFESAGDVLHVHKNRIFVLVVELLAANGHGEIFTVDSLDSETSLFLFGQFQKVHKSAHVLVTSVALKLGVGVLVKPDSIHTAFCHN